MPFKRFLIHDTDYGTAVSNGFNETSGFVSATSGGISQVKKPCGVTQNNTAAKLMDLQYTINAMQVYG